MTSLNRAKIIAAFLAVFIAGGVSGWFLSLRWGERQHYNSRPPQPEDFRQSVRDKYQRRLNLTPEQMLKVQPILDERFEALDTIHAEALQRIEQTCKHTLNRIADELTPEQQSQLEQMEKERREFRPRRFKGKPPG